MKNLLIIILIVSFNANSQVEKLREIAKGKTSSAYYPTFDSNSFDYPNYEYMNTPIINTNSVNTQERQAFSLVIDGSTMFSQGTVDIFNADAFKDITSYTIYDEIGTIQAVNQGTNVVNTDNLQSGRIYTIKARVGDNIDTFTFKKD